MISRTTRSFREAFEKLPADIQTRAKRNYKLWKNNPYHPSLRFRNVHASEPIYSVHIGRHYRAIGLREEDVIIWFWIGSHADYDNLLSRL